MKTFFLTFFSFLYTIPILYAQEKATTQSGKEVILYANGTCAYATSVVAIPNGVHQQLELPAIHPKEQVVRHAGYTLSYNEPHEQASWVAYVLTREKAQGGYERSDRFLRDPAITTGSATDDDYKGSGYDRGHLAPAADMGWSSTSMDESFYYSNMSPQLPGFNRGVWKRLEELMRYWAQEYDSLFIVTGPVLTPGLPTIGPNQVSVPQYYYKAVLRYTETGMDGIGFVLPNTSSSADLQDFTITIDSLETLTGLDLYPALEDTIEEDIEANSNLYAWTWTRTNGPSYISNHTASSSVESNTNNLGKETDGAGYKRAASIQCSGTTQKGDRCRNKTLSPNGRCWRHGGN